MQRTNTAIPAPGILQSGPNLQRPCCGWCWTLGNLEVTFVLVADLAPKNVKSSNHTKIKNASQTMNVTFPPCPAALPSLELSVYFSNTEQALMQKHIISFFLFKKCIEVSLIYNAVPISTVLKSDPVYIHMCVCVCVCVCVYSFFSYYLPSCSIASDWI